MDLTGDDVDALQIIGLDDSKLGPLDITTLILNDDTGTSNPFFRWTPTSADGFSTSGPPTRDRTVLH